MVGITLNGANHKLIAFHLVSPIRNEFYHFDRLLLPIFLVGTTPNDQKNVERLFEKRFLIP